MGARPICSLNSLRFGPPEQERNRFLLTGAVKGIGDYGNCLGVPVLGGEVFFDPTYTRNCLVNAMTVGVVEHRGMASARAAGAGNPVFVVGASTGRDGIHGASFASQDLSKESESKRSAVQVGDPFMEKLLLEATLELINSGAIVGIQDMGAAGLSCSSSEMSARGGCGMDLDLDAVPLREAGMNAYEIMLSESQERMLVVVKAGHEAEVRRIFSRWELNAERIGAVTDDGLLRIRREGKLCAIVPADSLVLGGGAPRYRRETRRPTYLDEAHLIRVDDLDGPAGEAGDPVSRLVDLLSSANICSRRSIYEQYDSEVGLVRMQGPGHDGGLALVPGTKKAIAVSTDCNSRYVYLDPAVGTAQAVAEAARNVAVTGARPIGITNCLNFGNPFVPENYFMFSESIRGMTEACNAFDIPVTGGNVSFYNESDDGPVRPTPTIGMVGLLSDIERRIPCGLASGSAAGVQIALVGDFQPTFGGSEYLFRRSGLVTGRPPALDLSRERSLVEFLCLAAESSLLEGAHDLSLGGLAVGLFRLLYQPATRELPGFALDSVATSGLRSNLGRVHSGLLWFGETNGCALVLFRPDRESELRRLAASQVLPFHLLGSVTGAGELDYAEFQVPANRVIAAYENGELTQAFQATAVSHQ